MRLTLAALAAAATVLAGCDLAPTYKVPTVAVPVSFHDTAIWQKAQPSDTLPRSDWWKGFNDPLLDKLEADLNAQNFTLAAATATYQQARANAAEAVAGLYPSIIVNGAVDKTSFPQDGVLKAHGLPTSFQVFNSLDGGLQYEFDFWDRVQNTVVAGKAAAQASAADLAFIRLSLEAELATDYLLLRGLDAQRDLLVHTVEAYQQALDVASNRFNGAIASGMDVSRAKAQLESARAQLEDVQARRAMAEHAIASLIAVPAPAFSIPPDLAEISLPELPSALPSVLLQRRPDIASAERQVLATNALIGVARSAFYPNVSLAVIGGLQSSGLSLFNLPNSFWSLGPGLTLPIFEGGLLNAQEAAAIASFNMTAANYRNTVVTAFQDVEDALAQLHWYAAEEADDKRAVAAAQQTLTMSMALYKDGATNFLEVVVAQESLLGSQQALLQLQTLYLQSGVRLIRALGGGWSAADLPKPDDTPLTHVDIQM